MKLQLALDRASVASLAQQISDQVWELVIEGRLEPGTRLPTVRQLAIDLGVHPDTVAQAYRQLELLGVAVVRKGSGTCIGLRLPHREELERQKRLEQICVEAVDECTKHGFVIDDLIDLLTELRRSRRDGMHHDE